LRLCVPGTSAWALVPRCSKMLPSLGAYRHSDPTQPSYTDKFVLARYRQGHWTGVSIALVANEVLIYNSLPVFATGALNVITQILRILV
jgi:hypothetical protein